MSLQGSIHRRSNGIGYGAYIPTKQAYYNARTPPTRLRQPSSERANYRRYNAKAGVHTHRSDISFGRTSESIKIGEKGDSRAREANKYLTSGEVGNFCLPAEQASHDDGAENNSGAAASKASLSSSTLLFEAHKKFTRKKVGAAIEGHKKKQQEEIHRLVDSCVGTARSSHQSFSSRGSSRRSNSSTIPSLASDKNSGRSSSQPSSRCSGFSDSSHREGTDGGKTGGQTTHPTSHIRADGSSFVGHTSHGSSSSSKREDRLRTRLIRNGEARQQQQSLHQGSPATHRFGQHNDLDHAFDRHHTYDLVAHRRAEEGKEVTGRFGPVDSNSVMAASLLTSELSAPWSHVLRGQKW